MYTKKTNTVKYFLVAGIFVALFGCEMVESQLNKQTFNPRENPNWVKSTEVDSLTGKTNHVYFESLKSLKFNGFSNSHIEMKVYCDKNSSYPYEKLYLFNTPELLNLYVYRDVFGNVISSTYSTRVLLKNNSVADVKFQQSKEYLNVFRRDYLSPLESHIFKVSIDSGNRNPRWVEEFISKTVPLKTEIKFGDGTSVNIEYNEDVRRFMENCYAGVN